MHVTIKAAALAGSLLAAGPAPAGSRTLGIITLISWVLTASIGGFMLSKWIARGGPREQRVSGEHLAPAVIFTHFGLAATGLLVWASYVATGWAALAWSGVFLLMPVIGLGLSSVTLWVPYPSPGGPGPAGGMLAAPAEDAMTRKLTDAQLTRALTDEVLAARLVDNVLASMPPGPSGGARRPLGHAAALIPVGHGIGALTTFLLAVLTAVGTL